MSRFIKSSVNPEPILKPNDICNIICNVLPTYCGNLNCVCCLTADNACGVCNLRSKEELIYSCPCWTICYGTSLILCLPTTQYNEFTFRISGICNQASTVNYQCIGFGNDTCFCDGTSSLCCGMKIRTVCGCVWNCYCCDRMMITNNPGGVLSGCNSFGYEISLKKSHFRENRVDYPFILFCGMASTTNFSTDYGAFLFSGLDGGALSSPSAACSRCWGNIASSTQFTRMCIQSNCPIWPNDVSGAYWYLYGVRR